MSRLFCLPLHDDGIIDDGNETKDIRSKQLAKRCAEDDFDGELTQNRSEKTDI